MKMRKSIVLFFAALWSLSAWCQDRSSSALFAENVPELALARWRAAAAKRQESRGRLDLAERITRGECPPGWRHFTAGDFGLIVAQDTGGLRIESLFDLAGGVELLAVQTPPLFEITLRQKGDQTDTRLTSDTGWTEVAISESGGKLLLEWRQPADSRLQGFEVTANAAPDMAIHAWRWTLAVRQTPPEWTVWKAVFPQVAVAELPERTVALFPRGPGELKQDLWKEPFAFQGRYPCGWCSMQFMAVYGDSKEGQPSSGLYFAQHDPFGSAMDIRLESKTEPRRVDLVFEHPAPDMGRPGNGYELPGETVWQLLRGDWFDASLIYRQWARTSARWWPQCSAAGREDTPLWMRELCAWAQTGGAPEECAQAVKDFAQYLDVPVGFHWYNWHQIPFDNDYPHYFPAKPGFEEAVRELQSANVYVMPYINGRLWDTRDKGSEDFEFTSVALSAVTKQEDGQPYKEKYGSKEQDGSPVWLGVMCPATPLWQNRVKDVVLNLERNIGVKGVYIDQIAAASPVLCMDAAHGHPLGGGHWWNEGYWRMLEQIRAEKPGDAMLTTECNAEPFIRWMDGYLTWHWQHDGQVPAFPAVYGGTLQMFGRAYGGGDTRDLALRMKAAQQLVFGEQIGWLNPALVNEPQNAEFFRNAVQLRWALRRYFYAGEMARPPKLIGEMPRVRADWQWSGEWWVSTDAVLTGAWQLPAEHKLVLFFANVSDTAVAVDLDFDPPAYGLPQGSLKITARRGKEGAQAAGAVTERKILKVDVPPLDIFAWEIAPE